jgi:hypothetical protein
MNNEMIINEKHLRINYLYILIFIVLYLITHILIFNFINYTYHRPNHLIILDRICQIFLSYLVDCIILLIK